MQSTSSIPKYGLQPVPGYESILLFDADQLYNDEIVDFYRVMKHKRKFVKFKLAHVERMILSDDRTYPKSARVYIMSSVKGKPLNLCRSLLTMRCFLGYPINCQDGWVVDHIDGNTLNDRISNLQVITQKQNLLRSERHTITNAIGCNQRRELGRRYAEAWQQILKAEREKNPAISWRACYLLRYGDVLAAYDRIFEEFKLKAIKKNGNKESQAHPSV